MNATLAVLHTSSRSYGPVPVQYGERLGWWSFVRWHCLRPMRRVWKPDDEGTIACKAWICPHCEHRKYPPLLKN